MSTIEFVDAAYAAVPLVDGAILCEHLTLGNSPLLFGCRTGICGTCVVRVDVLRGALPPPAEDERELLALLAPGDPRARLACQLAAVADLRIERVRERRNE